MIFKVIKTNDEFLDLQKYWNTLLSKSCHNHIHLTYEWISIWWRNFAAGKMLFIITATDSDNIIGIAPLMIQKVGRFYKNALKSRQVTFLGAGLVDSSDFVITDKRGEVFNGFFKVLKDNSHLWDEIKLSQISTSSPNYRLFHEMSNDYNKYHISFDILVGVPYVSIEEDFNRYYSSLSKTFVKQTERRIRKLYKEKQDISIDIVKQVEEKHLSEIHKLVKKRLTMTQHKSMFLDQAKLQFIKNIISEFNRNDWIRLFVIRQGNTMISYSLTFNYANQIYDWTTSYDPDYYIYSVGRVLIKEIIQYCYAHSIQCYDLMAGNEEYKFDWTHTHHTNHVFIMYKRTLKTKLFGLYDDIKNKLKKDK